LAHLTAHVTVGCSFVFLKSRRLNNSAEQVVTENKHVTSFVKLCLFVSGHQARVLHTSMSPDGTTVMSAAADETLRLWKCFDVDPVKAKKAAQGKAPVGPLHRGIR